jgi:hypothetical protein
MLLSIAPAGESTPNPAKIENFALLDHAGKFHEFDYYCRSAEVKAIVLFIQGNGCPLVRKRVPELVRLQKGERSRNLTMPLCSDLLIFQAS